MRAQVCVCVLIWNQISRHTPVFIYRHTGIDASRTRQGWSKLPWRRYHMLYHRRPATDLPSPRRLLVALFRCGADDAAAELVSQAIHSGHGLLRLDMGGSR